MDAVETYLRDVQAVLSSGAGTPELSLYPALSNLLNTVGRGIRPRVRCIMNLRNRGAGLPDGGLFTADQFPSGADHEPLPNQQPSRGAIEVKAPDDDAVRTAGAAQVARYWNAYRQVLVTNYRDFVLVGQDAAGQPTILETFSLAESEPAFRELIRRPEVAAAAVGDRLTEYLKRVLLHAAPLAAPKELAWFLASYAREAKARLEQSNVPTLPDVRTALEEALGLTFTGERGDQFFRSTLVQTLFYGVSPPGCSGARDARRATPSALTGVSPPGTFTSA